MHKNLKIARGHWCQWYRGINPKDTSTPTNDPARADVRIEFLQGFIQENEGFNNLCGQPGGNWPMCLSRQELRAEYARVYAFAEREYPEILKNNDYPHPNVIDSEGVPPNFRMADPDPDDSEPDVPEDPIGSDLRRYFKRKRSLTGYRSPVWPPRSLLDQQGRPSFGNLVRMRPGPTAYQVPPRPSTSAGSMTWQETKRALKPLNQESKKLLSDEFVREVELNKILEFKPKFDDNSKIAEVFNDAIRKHVGRRARFLEVYQKLQERWEQQLKLGIPISNPNPGYPEQSAAKEIIIHGLKTPVEKHDQTDELEEPSGEASTEPMDSMHSSILSEQPGICTPQCCFCDDNDCIWANANYTN